MFVVQSINIIKHRSMFFRSNKKNKDMYFNNHPKALIFVNQMNSYI
jgi:hypothetical protein